MPIPRHAEKEFFIPSYNELIYGNSNTNEAIIYYPDFSFSDFNFSFGYSVEINSFDERSTFFAARINLSDWIIIDDNDKRDEFISEISEIFNETTNNDFQSEELRDCLKEFLDKQDDCDDLCNLCTNFISEIPSNSAIQNLLGNELTIEFQRKVFDFYEKLKRKMNRMKKKDLYIQFKEFKIHQNYIQKRINYQMKDRITIKKMNFKSKQQKIKMTLLLNF